MKIHFDRLHALSYIIVARITRTYTERGLTNHHSVCRLVFLITFRAIFFLHPVIFFLPPPSLLSVPAQKTDGQNVRKGKKKEGKRTKLASSTFCNIFYLAGSRKGDPKKLGRRDQSLFCLAANAYGPCLGELNPTKTCIPRRGHNQFFLIPPSLPPPPLLIGSPSGSISRRKSSLFYSICPLAYPNDAPTDIVIAR